MVYIEYSPLHRFHVGRYTYVHIQRENRYYILLKEMFLMYGFYVIKYTLYVINYQLI